MRPATIYFANRLGLHLTVRNLGNIEEHSKIELVIKLLNKGALGGIYKYYNMVKDIELIAKEEDFEVF